MPNDIDAVVRELRAAYNNRRRSFDHAAEYAGLVSEHMPAILEALERVTGERDAAMKAVHAANTNDQPPPPVQDGE